VTISELLDKAAAQGDLAVARAWVRLSWPKPIMNFNEFLEELKWRGWPVAKTVQAIHDAETEGEI